MRECLDHRQASQSGLVKDHLYERVLDLVLCLSR